MTRTLQERLDDIRTGFEQAAPREAVEIMHRATQALVDSGLVERALGEGDPVPEFELPDTLGRRVTAKEMLARGPLVLNFYRGHWCPYCTAELEALHRVSPEIRATGATLLAVSPELPQYAGGLIISKGLGFEILRDEGNVLAEKFGLRFQLPEDLREVYLHYGIDVPGCNGEASWTLPLPARYVIDKAGTIRAAHVHADYTCRPETSETLRALRELRDD